MLNDVFLQQWNRAINDFRYRSIYQTDEFDAQVTYINDSEMLDQLYAESWQ